MVASVKLLRWILGLAFVLDLTEGFGHITYEMAKAAMHAQQHGH